MIGHGHDDGAPLAGLVNTSRERYPALRAAVIAALPCAVERVRRDVRQFEHDRARTAARTRKGQR